MKRILLIALMTAIASFPAVHAQDDPTVWDGESVSSMLFELDDVIEIHTAADLAAIHDLWDVFSDDGDKGYEDYTIKLMADIDLNNHNFKDYTIGWNDDHKFAGTFDGQGHIIRNLKIHCESNNRALFGKIDNGKIMNLKLVNVDICASDGDDCHIGALCGRMENHSTITHCAVVGGRVKGTDDDADEVGAIVGYMKNDHNDILYCYSDITVEADAEVGGIVGKVEQGDDHASSVRHCYFSGTVKHYGDEYFGAIAGERYGQPMENNFFLDREDGVRATGNDEDYDGSSYHSVKSEIKECTEEELKQPLLFGMFGKEDTEYVYPLNGYPELKVFLRYNPGDSFYHKNVGHTGENVADSVGGHVRIIERKEKQENKKITSFTVSLESTVATGGSDFTVNETFKPYFEGKVELTTTGLGVNVFESLGVVNTVTVPATVDSIAYPQRHQVQNAFVLSGDEGAVKDGGLYSLKDKYFITAPKTYTSLLIHQQFADNIADYAFENMGGLRTIYVDTWVEAGTPVDDGDNPPPTIVLDGDNIFSGCPEDIDIYIKDGTQDQLFLGYQGSGGCGYSNADGWDVFYSEYQDVPNHMYTYFPVNRNPGGLSTLILGYPVEMPEGVTAWWCSSLGDGKLNLEKIESGIVPALTPVLLAYEGTGPLYLFRYEGDNPGAATDYEGNLFKGSVDPGGHKVTSSEMMSNFLTLGRPSGDTSYDNLGFYSYHPKDNILPAYVAWLASSDVPTEGRMTLSFGGNPSSVSDEFGVKDAEDTDVSVYTLQGVRIDPSAMQKGTLYIVNGKKVIK